MTTQHTLKNFYNGTNGFEEMAIFVRPVVGQYATEEVWTLYRRVAPKTGRVRDFGVSYHKAGAVSPGDLTFTSQREAVKHLNSISGIRKVA